MGKITSKLKRNKQGSMSNVSSLQDRRETNATSQPDDQYATALYDYRPRDEEDLTFSKGDILKITSTAWFMGECIRENIEELLMNSGERGSFAVSLEEADQDTLLLSVRDSDNRKGDHVKHYTIRRNMDDEVGFFITEHNVFPTLTELVTHYQSSADGLCCILTKSSNKPPNNKWAIPRESLRLIKKLREEQEHGEIWEGMWNGHTRVEIKTYKVGTTSPDAFLAEANIMMDIRHENIVQLYAVCAEMEPIYIVREVLHFGSLLEFLSSGPGRRTTLAIHVEMAAQIANGMAYLESKHIVHNDVAARNVVVDENFNLKVDGFKLARQSEKSKTNAVTKCPLRWTAPEVVKYRQFTVKSDVWSFGILLSEILTFGSKPYPSMTTKEVVDQVILGYRMPCVHNCPDSLYDIMLKCWHKDPQQRPTFEFLHFFFDDYFVSTEPYYTNAEPWFWGKCTRKDAEKKLLGCDLQRGTFIVREGGTHADTFSLSVLNSTSEKAEQVKHYLINKKDNGGKFYIEERNVFEALFKLVEHYQNSVDGLCCKLTSPCPMEDSESYTYDK